LRRLPEAARHGAKIGANAFLRIYGCRLQRQIDQLIGGKMQAHLCKDLIRNMILRNEGQLFRSREVNGTLIS
jgi:hypothetical protein